MLTPSGVVVTAVVFLAILFITISNKYNQSFSEETLQLMDANAQIDSYKNLLSLFGNGCEDKANTQLKYLKKVINGSENPLRVFTYPDHQLSQLLDALREMLVTILSIQYGYRVSKEDIYVSLAFRMPLATERGWQWAEARKRAGLDIDTLSTDIHSTFYELISSKKRMVFYNSKAEAQKKGHYIIDPDERTDNATGEITGSIACSKIDVKYDNEVYIESVLSISTYRKPFAENDDDAETARINMEDFLIPQFEKRFRVELCNYYMDSLNRAQDSLTAGVIN